MREIGLMIIGCMALALICCGAILLAVAFLEGAW